jgi:ribose transport system permease protein
MLVLIIFFAIDPTTGGTFRSSANLHNIFANQAVTALVALAMVVPLIGNYFDLSVSATTGVSNVTVAATLGTYHFPIWLGVLAGLAIGALIGFINGFLVARVRLNGMVVTLGTYTALLGLVTLYTGGELITVGIPASFGQWSNDSAAGIPNPFLLLMAISLVVWFVLRQLPYGRRLSAIGSNERAAHLVGINTTRTVWISFVLSGVLAAAAGALQTARGGAGDPTIGSAYLFPSLAAVFLGATTINPGKYNVWGTIIGVFFVAISVSGLTLLGADIWVQPVFDGLALVVAVALSTLIARRREAAMTRAASLGHLGSLLRRGAPGAAEERAAGDEVNARS